MSKIAIRSKALVNLADFRDTGGPEKICNLDLTPPTDRQYILRMVVRNNNSELYIPEELEWTRPLYDVAFQHQLQIGANHPFCYITVRSGIVTSTTDDEWHLDGFSTKTPHVPEQNYIWTNIQPTEAVAVNVNFPKNFDPRKHNLNTFLARHVDEKNVVTCEENTVYCIDPYILHRRPNLSNGIFRTFVRISFVPIEINDVNNTQNPYLPCNYTHDGVKFRNTLLDYNSNIS